MSHPHTFVIDGSRPSRRSLGSRLERADARNSCSWVIRLRRRYSGWAGVPEGGGPTRSGTGGEFAERDLRRRGLHQALLDQGEFPGRGIAPQVGFACLAVGM